MNETVWTNVGLGEVIYSASDLKRIMVENTAILDAFVPSPEIIDEELAE